MVYISWHLVSCTPRDQHFHFWFRPFAGKIALSWKTTGQCSHLVHFGSWHYAIKYIMRDMMKYHCLRVFRRRVKRIGKHSTGFSMFRTREHGCSDAELCCVPIQSTGGAIFFLAISISHARQVVNEVGRFSLTDGVEWSRITSILSNYFVNFRRVDILHLVETMPYSHVMLSKTWITNNGLCNKYLLWTQTIQKCNPFGCLWRD